MRSLVYRDFKRFRRRNIAAYAACGTDFDAGPIRSLIGLTQALPTSFSEDERAMTSLGRCFIAAGRSSPGCRDMNGTPSTSPAANPVPAGGVQSACTRTWLDLFTPRRSR
jgi:hypothetical protein